jgi:hypothetical protein
MAVRDDCRHYVMQTVRGGERIERCRVGANSQMPFSCPEGCLFFEPRRTSSAGWSVERRGEGPDPAP